MPLPLDHEHTHVVQPFRGLRLRLVLVCGKQSLALTADLFVHIIMVLSLRCANRLVQALQHRKASGARDAAVV